MPIRSAGLAVMCIYALASEMPAQTSSVVILPDISNSAGRTCLATKQAVRDELARLPEGSWIAVIGVSENTFTRPIVMLVDSVPVRLPDGKSAGQTPIESQFVYYAHKTRVYEARARILDKWDTAVAEPSAVCDRPGTDILGALALAPFYLKPNVTERRLVIIGDGRNMSRVLDLETPMKIGPEHLGKAERLGRDVEISGVHVCFIAIPARSRDLDYWRGLRVFWEKFFESARASLEFTPTYVCAGRQA